MMNNADLQLIYKTRRIRDDTRRGDTFNLIMRLINARIEIEQQIKDASYYLDEYLRQYERSNNTNNTNN